MNTPLTPEGLSLALARIEAYSHGLATGGIRAERSVIDAAKNIVTDAPDDWRLPQITLSDDGEIGLSWYGPGGEIHVAVDADHTAWVALDREGHCHSGIQTTTGAPIPESVILSMRAIYPSEPRA